MSSDKIIFAFDISVESDTDPAYIKRTKMFSDMLDYVGIVKIGMEAFYSTNGEILNLFEPQKVFLAENPFEASQRIAKEIEETNHDDQ